MKASKHWTTNATSRNQDVYSHRMWKITEKRIAIEESISHEIDFTANELKLSRLSSQKKRQTQKEGWNISYTIKRCRRVSELELCWFSLPELSWESLRHIPETKNNYGNFYPSVNYTIILLMVTNKRKRVKLLIIVIKIFIYQKRCTCIYVQIVSL